MSKIRYFLFFILFVTIKCYAITLSKPESAVLEEFFKTMIENSEGGYVLFGKKPVCMNGFSNIDNFYCESEHHYRSVCLRESAPILRKLNLNSLNRNVLIHVYNQPDCFVKNCTHILVINKDLFLQTVQLNLPLFQYVLGPDVTPQKLLEKLVDPNEQFYSVIKGDKVLIGILLGFGIQNSLYVSRIENLEDSLFAAEQPPLKSQLSKLGVVREEFKHGLLVRNKSSHSQETKVQPSFGYDSLKEEMQSLNNKIEISSQKLVNQTPIFAFGRLKDDNESDKLVPQLESTQNEIKKLLSSSSFFQDVVQAFDIKEITRPRSDDALDIQLTFTESETNDLAFLVAANIWRTVDDENEEYYNSFICGIKECESGKIIPLDALKSDPEFAKKKAISKIRSNLLASDAYFLKLKEDENEIGLIPLKLYYKIIKEGSDVGASQDSVLNDQTKVTLHYTIKSPDDEILSDTWAAGIPIQLNLLDTIPGFSLGMQGMKIGETREILIHPSLGYGIYTTLDKGIYLRATVQLLGIEEDDTIEKIPELTVLDFTNDIGPDIDVELSALTKKVGYARGYKIWQHYKKSNAYNLTSVLKEIALIKDGKDADISSKRSQDIINRLHWNIYHSAQ